MDLNSNKNVTVFNFGFGQKSHIAVLTSPIQCNSHSRSAQLVPLTIQVEISFLALS
jgi:hypothetical protein